MAGPSVNGVPILNSQREMRFHRRVDHDLRVGWGVIYYLPDPADFMIVASRAGISIKGQLTVPPAGIEAVQRLLQRARLHYDHLTSVPVGEKQTVLSEADIDQVVQMQLSSIFSKTPGNKVT